MPNNRYYCESCRSNVWDRTKHQNKFPNHVVKDIVIEKMAKEDLQTLGRDLLDRLNNKYPDDVHKYHINYMNKNSKQKVKNQKKSRTRNDNERRKYYERKIYEQDVGF